MLVAAQSSFAVSHQHSYYMLIELVVMIVVGSELGTSRSHANCRNTDWIRCRRLSHCTTGAEARHHAVFSPTYPTTLFPPHQISLHLPTTTPVHLTHFERVQFYVKFRKFPVVNSCYSRQIWAIISFTKINFSMPSRDGFFLHHRVWCLCSVRRSLITCVSEQLGLVLSSWLATRWH